MYINHGLKVIICLISVLLLPYSLHAAEGSVKIRVGAYNVLFGKYGTPKQFGDALKKYNFDIIGFNEAPDGEWTKEVGKFLGMNYAYVGKISSANHKDKYKSILSRTPLTFTEEFPIKGRGWNPCSVVKGTTDVRGVKLNFYSLHICESHNDKGHGYYLASEILSRDKSKNIIVVGDFNNHLNDYPMQQLDKAGFRAAWEDVKIHLTAKWTWNAFTPKGETGVIDHILYNKSSGAKATQAEVIEMEKHISDHKAVRAEITFPNK